MSDPTPDIGPKPKRRWVMPVLFVSLALNLLVVGAILGRALAPDEHRNRDRIAGPIRSVIGEPFVRALSRGDRKSVLSEIREQGPRFRQNRENLRQRVTAFLDALRAEPFDAERVRKLMEEQRQVARGRQELGETLLLNRLSQMTTEERLAYADRLEKSLKNLRRR